MMLSRRAFLGRVAAGGLCGAIFGKAHAQDQPQAGQTTPQGSQPVRSTGPYRSPYQVIEDAASAMKPGNADSVRAVVEALFKFPGLAQRMPNEMAAVVKQRLIDAQMAYLDGKSLWIADGAIVDAINALTTAFDAPDYARVSWLQVRLIQSTITSVMPIFMQLYPSRMYSISEYAQPGAPYPILPSVPMSPLQAIFVTGLLIDQKLWNSDYQAAPAEWDRDFYPRLLKEMEARQELQRRIAAGEVQPETRAFVTVGSPDQRALEMLVLGRIAAMSLADGITLFNETFARLGIQ